MAHPKVKVRKGKRLPHGYGTMKGKNKNKSYGTKEVKIDKGFRIRHGTKTIPAANPNAYYEKGGDIKSLNAQIAEYQEMLKDPSAPADEKDCAEYEIGKLKEQISAIQKTAKKPKKAPVKKSKATAPTKSDLKSLYDAEKMLAEAKERHNSRKK